MSEKETSSERQAIERVSQLLSQLLYAVAAIALFVFALGLLGIAVAEVVGVVGEDLRSVTLETLNSVGLIVIAIATLDLAKFLVEEELVRQRELRSPREARRSLTKFITIVIIAVSLEAIVLVFQVKAEGDTAELIYPAALLASGVLALIGLALFQWFSSNADLARKDVRGGIAPED